MTTKQNNFIADLIDTLEAANGMIRTDIQITTYKDDSETVEMSMKHVPTGLIVSAFGTNAVILKMKLMKELGNKVDGEGVK